MKFDSRDGREDGGYSGIDFVEISQIFAMQNTYFSGSGPLDGVKFIMASLCNFQNIPTQTDMFSSVRYHCCCQHAKSLICHPGLMGYVYNYTC